LFDIGQPIFGYPLSSKGVAWEEDLFGDFALLGTDMYAHKFRVCPKVCISKHGDGFLGTQGKGQFVGLKIRHAHRRVAGHFERGGVKGLDLAYFDPSLTLISCLFYGAFLDMSIA